MGKGSKATLSARRGRPITVTIADAVMGPQVEIQKLQQRRHVLITYMHEQAKVEDWHGVSDAANDLREVDKALEIWRGML